MSNEAEVEGFERTVEPPGARLRAAREAAGLKRSDVALELRLGVETIEALERDDVDKLPAPIFVRGYLRNYALLLGLPPQELVDAYNGSVGHGQSHGPMAGPMQQQLVGARRRTYLVWLLVLAAAVAAGWWFQRRAEQPLEEPPVAQRGGEQAPDSPAASSGAAESPTRFGGAPSQAQSPTEAGAGEQEPGAPAVPPQAEPVAPPPEDVPPAAAATGAETSAQTPAPASQAENAQPAVAGDTLTLAFSDRSWVEVRDAAGKRLLYRLADAGETRTLQGKAPFRLVLGNAPAVRVELNGESVDVAAHTRGRTARFSVAP